MDAGQVNFDGFAKIPIKVDNPVHCFL